MIFGRCPPSVRATPSCALGPLKRSSKEALLCQPLGSEATLGLLCFLGSAKGHSKFSIYTCPVRGEAYGCSFEPPGILARSKFCFGIR